MYADINKYRNVYKGFRDPTTVTGSSFNKSYDEPTYLTFSVFFRSVGNPTNEVLLTNYDLFPHPLLSKYKQDSYDRTEYSSLQYLRDNNEFVREELLKRFIDDLDNLQSYYQWYFQGISGLNNIMSVNPERGRRVPTDGKITFRMLEGLDQKVFNLLNLYRKIAWDDVYQRWMLPDMMRYFIMDIYITEFRTFHRPLLETTINDPNETKPGNFFNRIFKRKNYSSKPTEIILQILNNVMPTWKITCERCEFDISSINRQVDAYSVNEDPAEQIIEFDIKVGQIKEELINPVLDYYYSDKILNGKQRSIEFVSKLNQDIPKIPFGDFNFVNANLIADPTRVSSNNKVNPNISLYAQGVLLSDQTHITGQPFNQNISIKQMFGTIAQVPPGATLQPDFDPISQSTWISNAISIGKSFGENWLESKIDKLKMTKIPNLGISVQEAISAIESKNFFTVFGLIRQAMDKTFELSVAPSELLDKKIVDGSFKKFLEGITLSEATDEDSIELKKFADMSLTDENLFKRIKDFSLATDLVAENLGEVNIPNPIENPDAYANSNIIKDDETVNLSDLKPEFIIFEGIPSSQATEGKIE